MDIITLLVLVIVVVAAVWGGFSICDRAGFPVPLRWIWGAICLIVLLYFLLGRISGGSAAFQYHPL